MLPPLVFPGVTLPDVLDSNHLRFVETKRLVFQIQLDFLKKMKKDRFDSDSFKLIGTVVEHSPRHPKVEGSIPATDAVARREKISTNNWCYKWKRISHKQSTRWKHLSQLKASAFFSL